MPLDDQVVQAMRRWPQVPAVHGWLRLDRRGRWLLVDRGRPDFDEARDGAGSGITSPPILDFIGRNYGADEAGRWFWQNGPQRVFVDVDLAPLVLRVVGEATAASLVTHTGYPVDTPQRGWMDEDGNVFLETTMGPGVLHDLDLAGLELDEDSPGLRLRLGATRVALVPLAAAADDSLGFVRRPRP